MSEESKIYNDNGELIAIRHVEEYNGGNRVTTQDASEHILFGEQRGSITDDRDVYPDGSEYEHQGSRLK